jgi:hypothetical protein
MKEMSAVEWLEGYLTKFNHIEESLSVKKAFEHAKEMEKQQNKLRIKETLINLSVVGLAVSGIFVIAMGNDILGCIMIAPLAINEIRIRK